MENLTIRHLLRVSRWVQQGEPDAVNAMMRTFRADQPVPELRWKADLANLE